MAKEAKDMPDKVLTCQNCHSPFVYSELEQAQNQKRQSPEPVLCTICTAIKQSQTKHPPKPRTNLPKL